MNKNKITLRFLLLISFIGFSFLMISITIVTTNVMLKNEFLHYIDKTQEHETVKIISVLKQEYNLEESLNNKLIDTLEESARNGYIINISNKDKIIYDGFVNNSKQIQRLREEHQQQEIDALNYYDDLYAIDENKIKINNDEYDITIFLYRPAFINTQGFEHLASLDSIFLYVSIISIVVSLILGYILTNMLALPLKKIVNKFNLMEQGDYENEASITSSIYEYQEIEKSFNNLNSSLNKQREIRKNLSSDISHELRTPLTAIALTLENLEEDVWSFNKDVQNSLLDETNKMQSLIDDIHKLEEVQSNVYNLKIEEIEIKQLIDNIIVLFKPLIEEKNIKVIKNIEQETIYADLNRINQVLVNVISNAIKYNKNDGEIIISVTSEDDSNIISIKDNGIGIRKDLQSKIFDRFYRVNDINVKSQKGSGVGLTVVEDIVKAHNGEVLVFSNKDQGCEIVIVLRSNISS